MFFDVISVVLDEAILIPDGFSLRIGLPSVNRLLVLSLYPLFPLMVMHPYIILDPF